MNNLTLMANLRCIPDFPQKGINFRDVTTLFKNPDCLRIMVDELYEIYKDKGITKIVGKEYGSDTIEIHKDAITSEDVVLLHDDLLATGGTMKAAYNLVKKFNPKNIYVNFIIEITDEGLHGRDLFNEETELTTLITV